MIDWEYEAGEDFLDEFDSNVSIPNLMFWCLGKGYITESQFNVWEKDFSECVIEAQCLNYIVHDYDGDVLLYALFSEEEWTEEGRERAYGILAEFIASSNTYKKRLLKFLANN